MCLMPELPKLVVLAAVNDVIHASAWSGMHCIWPSVTLSKFVLQAATTVALAWQPARPLYPTALVT